MDVEFRDRQKLELIETDDAVQSGLPLAVINSLRRKLVAIRAAADERDLRNWKSLHFEKLKGDMKEKYSIRLNDQWRLIFQLDIVAARQRMIALEVKDYHD